MTTKTEKNIALVGIGSWGKNLAKELYKQGVLLEVVDSSKEETKSWIEENIPDVKIAGDLEEILTNPEIKAVVVATPIKTHFEIALKIIQAGKDLFLEKPATEKSTDVEILISEAKKKNIIFQVGYEFFYDPALQAVKEKIKNETIKNISFVWKKWGSFKAHPVINLLVHEISILKSLGFKDVKILKYTEIKGENDPDGIEVEALSGEIPVTFTIDRASKEKSKTVTIETDRNNYVVESLNVDLLGEEIKNFISNIENRTTPKTDGNFAKEILEIIESIPKTA